MEKPLGASQKTAGSIPAPSIMNKPCETRMENGVCVSPYICIYFEDGTDEYNVPYCKYHKEFINKIEDCNSFKFQKKKERWFKRDKF